MKHVAGGNYRHSRMVKRTVRPARFFGMDALESRQLMSVVVDVRLPGGAKSITPTAVGQVIQLEAWATVTGTNSSTADDGLQSIAGSFLSKAGSGGNLLGNLTAGFAGAFSAMGSQQGTIADLDTDTDLDVGTNVTGGTLDGFFNARAGSMQTSGTVVGSSLAFKIATLSFTVKTLSSGQSTSITFRPAQPVAFTAPAIWREDNVGKNANSGSFLAGTPVVISAPSSTKTGTASGTVYNDANGNGAKDSTEGGISGVTVYADINNNNVMDASETRVVTGSTGAWSISGLPLVASSSTFDVIRQIVPSGFSQTQPVSNMGQHVSPTSASPTVTNANFGDKSKAASPGSISGNVFNDLNGSSAKDSGEPNLVGWKIYLDTNKNGVLDSGETSTTTDSSGNYKFSNLPANITYRVREVVQSGFRIDVPTAGFYDVLVGSGSSITGKTFADTQKVSISGSVFSDVNSNGVKDSGDNGLANVTVYIDLNNNGKFDAGENSKPTDSSGNFTFFALSAPSSGKYVVRIVPPSGKKQTLPKSSAGITVTIASGGVSTGNVFGVH